MLLYAAARVLHGISLSMQPGSSMALLGRNGVGKTTLLNTLIGFATIPAVRDPAR
ncbi:MAG: ATP-binding cassette domain-containing protein [Xanthobacteraceae bacterium]|nr:ATP-binding cassette domain-containing protein [Xanthobacteraceae bacterium]